ncbi:unnamed protein product [Albugo candida]|uniref:Peptidase A1 domain-containing protein n=1 Tax=Albugo candida TaxID=65357 RepID=A0A024FX41_9STRA|nr:unnamed protein product [Albugo candida]|eukprot:CCI11467.1 unnamed protein product [Albugo candida]
MKYHHLKAYGLAVIGVFHAYAPFLSGQYVQMIEASPTAAGITDSKKRGLKVIMSPPLEFTADGLLSKPQSTVVEYYDMKLALIDLPAGSSPVPVKVSRRSAVRPFNTDKVCHEKTRLNHFEYCTKWKLTWVYLVELTETGKLYHFPRTSMDVNFYMSEYSGPYSKRFGRRYYDPLLGLHKYPETETPSMEIKASNMFFEVLNLKFFERLHRGQIVQLRLDDEATKVSPAIFSEIGDKIPSFTIGSDGRYYGLCTEVIKGPIPTLLLDLIMGFEKSRVNIWAYHLIYKKSKDSNDCTLLIEDSHKQNLWSLGYSFFKAYAVLIDTVDAHDKSQLIKFYYKNIKKEWHF